MTRLVAMTTGAIAEIIRALPGVEAYIDRAKKQDAESTHDRRLQLHAEIVQMEVAALEAAREHQRVTGPMDARIFALERDLAKARQARYDIEYARRTTNLWTSQQLDRLRCQMNTTAPHDVIEAFVQEMTELAEGLRIQYDEIRTRGRDGNVYLRWSNADSISRCHAVIGSVQRAARALANEALDETALRQQFAVLRATIPAIDGRPANAHML